MSCTSSYSWVQVRAVKSPTVQSRPGPKWLLFVSKFEVPLAWNEISGRWWAQGCYRGLVWGPNRWLLFQRHRLLKRKVGQMHWSKGGLFWKIMLKPSSNLWVKPRVLRTYWTTLVYITVKYRSSSILVITRKILATLWPFFDLVFVVLSGG